MRGSGERHEAATPTSGHLSLIADGHGYGSGRDRTPPPWRVVGVCVLVLAFGLLGLAEGGPTAAVVGVGSMQIASRILRSWAPS
ncbi:MAG: hypothetical protein KY469_15850 [Actinobacteria bacterium]|nr:hypothetical protein [Actinomycetota bacterium]